jgi:glucose-6-phosphate isomerase
MSVSGFNPTQTVAWQALNRMAAGAGQIDIKSLLSKDELRVKNYSIACGGLYLDYSKNLVTDDIVQGLLALVEASPLKQQRQAMFRGDIINASEQRPALHPALRLSVQAVAETGLEALAGDIAIQKQQIFAISEKIRSGRWLGATGKPITQIVNLGIGGSDLGPKLACTALKEFSHPDIHCHFVSNVDGEVIRSTLKKLDPETTLVIIASKSFATQETLLNASMAAAWFADAMALDKPYQSPHFIAITAAPDKALSLGIQAENVLRVWDWVGGRYSLWSAIGLSIAISLGYDNFDALLEGARTMDEHFLAAPLRQNMPVILAMLGIWYSNFLNAESYAVIPYCERLFQLPFYLQQLDMESNGKSVTANGTSIDYATGPIVWGLTGTNSQHSFFQLLHQGTHLIPVDFVGIVEDSLSTPEHHKVLLANMLAQAAALMAGNRADDLPGYRRCSGNRPSNIILLDRLTPRNLGSLLALYEHKIFVQGCIWNINSFDQWGVELGKVLTGNLLDKTGNGNTFDSSTLDLLARLRCSK